MYVILSSTRLILSTPLLPRFYPQLLKATCGYQADAMSRLYAVMDTLIWVKRLLEKAEKEGLGVDYVLGEVRNVLEDLQSRMSDNFRERVKAG